MLFPNDTPQLNLIGPEDIIILLLRAGRHADVRKIREGFVISISFRHEQRDVGLSQGLICQFDYLSPVCLYCMQQQIGID